jgi:uncharacterized membrane protein
MAPSVFLLVLIAAFCHASWNFASRKIAGNLVAIWLGLWIGCITVFPGVIFIFLHEGFRNATQIKAIACIVATGLLHGIYFRLVSAAYEQGEISTVYPIARGSGIALTAILAFLFFNERYTFQGIIGIGLISGGIFSLSTIANRGIDDLKAVMLALAIGSTIVAYSLVDKIGVSYINPVLYIWLMFLIAAIVLTPALKRRYRYTLSQIAKQYIGYAIIIGVGSIGTYLLILYAFTIGPVGYIVAVRELSVVFGSLAGIIFLKERSTFAKIAAICVIVIGNICIRMI